jgi:hypothetical protein
MTISPDGGTLFVASVTPQGVLAFSLPNLSDAGSYPTTMSKTSVAVSGEHLAVGGWPYNYWEDEVLIFPLGAGTARNWYKVEPPNVLPRGLQFKPDSSALFAVSSGATVVFHVLEGPTREGSRVSLTEGPSSVTAGTPVSLSGTLEFPFGGSTAGKTIHGYRKGSDDSWAHFGSAVTDATGAFFLQDVPTVSDTYRYRAGWSGDADHAGVNSHWFHTTVDPAEATLALKAFSPYPLGSLGLGKSLVLTGQLISPFGEDLVDETVIILRRSPAGSETLVDTTTTGTGGSFTFQDTPPSLGKWRYRALWAGDVGHLPAESHSLSVNVIPLKTAPLTLTAQWPVVQWGHTVLLKAQGGALSSENRLISIYQTPVGGTKTLLATRALQGGRVHFSVSPSINATYEAEWSGDHIYATALSQPIQIDVQAVMKGRLLGGVRRNRSYREYGQGVVPRFRARAFPIYPGAKLHFLVQKRVRGDWKTIRVLTEEIGTTGWALVKLHFAHRGLRYRVRAEFADHADHRGSKSDWAHFERI